MPSLKMINMPSIVAMTLINTGLLYFFSQSIEIDTQVVGSFMTNWKLSGLAAAVSTVAIGALSLIIPRQVKDALVYLRWPYAAPGHRAFSIYAQRDIRVDYERLKADLPELQDQLTLTPVVENKVWYRLFKANEKIQTVSHAHRMWLMYRDLTTLAYIFLGAFVIVYLYLKPDINYDLYLAIFILELLLFWSAAWNSGVQLICNVLASASTD
ncbi:hypothetical protein [Methylovulum miyakonense]|uniref:hypothetical protein n=1 Tax=Methylovulum miyakonense TaxID=645578 RepID=UPI00036D63EA|nr:hypothetical protein [Methylovulum miyakonense]